MADYQKARVYWVQQQPITEDNAERVADDKHGDPYDILGVDRSATQDDIKKAYKHLALILHPDRGATTGGTRFKRLQPAYKCLSDPQKREAYDQSHPVRSFRK